MLDRFFGRNKVSKAIRFLAKERNILLNGPLADLEGLSGQRVKIVDSLTNGETPFLPSEIEAIRRDAKRNQTLFEASLSGLESARQILGNRRQDTENMGVYTDTGHLLEQRKPKDLKPRGEGSEKF